MPLESSLIAPTAQPRLEAALLDKLAGRGATPGAMGPLGPLAIRLGLVQGSLKPRLQEPQLLIFAGDHGLAVERALLPSAAGPGSTEPTTAAQASDILRARHPLTLLAQQQRVALTLVDAGMAEAVVSRPQLMARKIAHGTRNARVGESMTVDQAHAAIRAGMEIADALPGNVFMAATLGVAGSISAALVMSQLSGADIRSLLDVRAWPQSDAMARVLSLLGVVQARHKRWKDPVEVLAALGGFETAMLTGAILVAASKRHVVVIDGMGACAALMAAAHIAPAVVDYAVFCRSRPHAGLFTAWKIFGSQALPEMGLETLDGTAAALSWSWLMSASGLLTQRPDGTEPDPTVPEGLSLPGFSDSAGARPSALLGDTPTAS